VLYGFRIAGTFRDLARLLRESDGLTLDDMKARLADKHIAADVEAEFDAMRQQAVIRQDASSGLWFWDSDAATY
jgi:hypothetical protein